MAIAQTFNNNVGAVSFSIPNLVVNLKHAQSIAIWLITALRGGFVLRIHNAEIPSFPQEKIARPFHQIRLRGTARLDLVGGRLAAV